MESTPTAVVLLDESWSVKGVVGDARRVGLSGELLGRRWAEVFAAWSPLPIPPENGTPLPCRAQTVSPGGEVVNVEFHRVAGINGAGGLAALLRRDAAGTLTARQQELCGLGEVAANVAHEINNAVTLLNGWLSLLLGDMGDGDPHRETLQLLVGETERIGKLTRNVLQVARSDPEEAQAVSLGALLMETLNLVRYDMQNRGIEISMRIADDLPPVYGSAAQLKQAVLNLLVNARDAMPAGGRLNVVADVEDGIVRLVVEDSGCGIPEAARAAIFSPFYTTKEHGTGLGLPVTCRIVKDHGGSLDLESRPDAGTRFILKFPARAA